MRIHWIVRCQSLLIPVSLTVADCEPRWRYVNKAEALARLDVRMRKLGELIDVHTTDGGAVGDPARMGKVI